MSRIPADAKFLDAESQVFASYGLEPRTRQLRLETPKLTVRVVAAPASLLCSSTDSA